MPNSYLYGLGLVKELGPGTAAGKKVFDDTVQMQSQLHDSQLIFLYAKTGDDMLQWSDPVLSVNDLRYSEKEIVELPN